MNSTPENIPKEELIFQLQQAKREVKNLSQENKTLEQENKRLEWQLKEMRRLIYGASKERFEAANNPFQLTLPFEVKENSTFRGIASAFAKYNGSRISSRVVLNRFIGLIT